MSKKRIINPRRNRLLRQRVPVHENLSVAAIGLLLVAIVLWVAAQKDNFRAQDRDISTEQLVQASRDQTLYTPPLQPWVEPGNPRQTAANTVIAPFPQSLVDASWTPAAAVKRFDADNLFEKINGEAPRFLRQGFVSLHYLVLRSEAPPAEIAIELFDQGDIGGSMGVFGEHVSADKTVHTLGAGTYFRTSIGAIGRSDRHFYRIAGDAASEPVQRKAMQIVAALNGAPASVLEVTSSPSPEPGVNSAPESAEPVALRILRDGLEMPAELISYQSSNVFQYDFANQFWFGRYRQVDTERLFIHRADSAEAAQRLYGELLTEHEYEYEAVQIEADGALLRQPFLDDYFLLRVRGVYVFGVDHAVSPASADAAALRLGEALPDE